MALRTFTVSTSAPPAVSEPADLVESVVQAVEAVEEAETEAEELRAALSSDVTLIVNEESAPTREQVIAALDAFRAQLLSSDLYTEAWYTANEE